MVDTSVFHKLKTPQDYQREHELVRRARREFEMNQQYKQAQIGKLQSDAQVAAMGGDDPAAIKIYNRLQELKNAGDVEGFNLLQSASKMTDRGIYMQDDGTFTQMPGYADALGQLEYGKQQGGTLGKKEVESIYNPVIAGGEADARNQSDLGYKPLVERAIAEQKAAVDNFKASSEAEMEGDNVSSLIRDAIALNENTLPMAYSGTGPAQVGGRILGADYAKNTDLLKQARLKLAIPLAKQLGVNPTDRDFQATLDSIFDVNSTRESREAQLKAILAQVEAADKAREENAQRYQNFLGGAPQSAPPANSHPPLKAGDVEDGYIFLGGDPTDKKRWKRMSK